MVNFLHPNFSLDFSFLERSCFPQCVPVPLKKSLSTLLAAVLWFSDLNRLRPVALPGFPWSVTLTADEAYNKGVAQRRPWACDVPTECVLLTWPWPCRGPSPQTQKEIPKPSLLVCVWMLVTVCRKVHHHFLPPHPGCLHPEDLVPTETGPTN